MPKKSLANERSALVRLGLIRGVQSPCDFSTKVIGVNSLLRCFGVPEGYVVGLTHPRARVVQTKTNIRDS